MWGTDWERVVSAMAAHTDEKGRRVVDFSAVVYLDRIPVSQIRALEKDPRGRVVGSLDEVIRELRAKKAAQDAAQQGKQ